MHQNLSYSGKNSLKHIFWTHILLLHQLAQVFAQTEVSGDVSGRWTLDASPYLIVNDAVVGSGQMLEIDPGVVIQFRDADDDLWIDGTLKVNGSETASVVFTSDNVTKEPGQWGGLIFRRGSDASVMNHAVIEFGGGFRSEQLRIENASPTLQSITLKSGRSSGLGIFGGSPLVTDTTFLENENFAATVGTDAFPLMSHSSASNNGSDTIGRHGGTIPESGTWRRDQIPYKIINDITIPEGVTLSIEPGSTIQFRDDDDDLWVDGVLHARGTPEQPIRFTSDSAEPTPGQWGAVLIRNQGEQERSELVSCVFDYGGGFRNGMLHCQEAHPLVQSCTFQFSRLRGIELTDASPEISDTVFRDNGNYAMGLNTQSYPILANNRAENNQGNSAAVFGGTILQSGTWQAANLPFTLINDITIAATASLTISPGSTIQFQDSDDDIVVDGALIARGTSSRPILFTSNESEKAPGQWGALLVRESSDDTLTTFDHCTFECGGGFRGEMMLVTSASPTIHHAHFRNSRARGLTLNDSLATVSNTHFSDNTSFALGMNVASFPIWNSITATDNGANAIAVNGGILTGQGTWQASDVPYTILDDVTIASEAQLTIAPGNRIQFRDGDDDLWIDGTLIAVGTANEPIYFTSDETEKAPGQWGSVRIRDASRDDLTRLSHCRFEFGGGFQNEILSLEQASPTIAHCIFQGSRNRGLTLIDSQAVINHCQFIGNQNYAMGMNTGSFPVNTSNTGEANGSNSIAVLGSTVSSSGVWQRDILPYTLVDDVTIAQHATLTIQPGTTIQFQDSDDDFWIDGALIASGSRDAPIRFTSNDSEKQPGQWGALMFRDASNDAVSKLERAIIEYGGGFRTGQVELTDAEPTIREVEFHHSRVHGLVIRGSSPSIEHGLFRDNNDAGIHASRGATPLVRNSTFSGNHGNGITNGDTSVIIDAIQNFWGDPSGPLDTRNDDNLDQTNPDGTGDSVSEFVRWRPQLESTPNPPSQPEPQLPLAPTLGKLDPNEGFTGTEITLSGTHFSPSLNENIVRIGTFTAELIRLSSEELVARIPAGLSPGLFDITVTTETGQSNSLPFEVVPSPESNPSPLDIRFGDPGQVVLSWEPSEPAPQLQTTTTMHSPIHWTRYEGPVDLMDGRMSTTVATSEPQAFFRLNSSSPPPDSPDTPGTLRLPDDWIPTYGIIDQDEVFITPSQGGSVQLKNGAKVTLPSGALAESALLRIVQLDFTEYTTDLKRDVYQIEAEGQALLRPATIELPYQHLNRDGNVAVFHADPGEPAEELTPQFDTDTGFLQIQTMRFSIFDVEDEGDYGEIFKDVILDPSRSRVLTVPYYSQNLSQWCFAAASQMILKYQGVDVEPWDIAKYFGLRFDSGASIWQLWAGHYRQLYSDLGASVKETTGWLAPANLNGYIIQQIDNDRPVFLVIRHAIHAIVVVGYSQAGVFIHDPSGDALKYGKGTKPPNGQWSRQFLNWDEWTKVINLWPTQYTPIAVPSWAIVLHNTRSEEASPATITLPSASINNERAGSGYIEIDRNDAPTAGGLPGGISESHFLWNGTKPLGYEFLPNRGFAPPVHAAINDWMILKADVSNSGTTALPVSIRVQLANDTIFELETPHVIPPTTNNQLIEIFGGIGDFRITDTQTSIRLGSNILNYQLLVNGNVVDEIPITLEIGPSRPTGVLKSVAEDGIRIQWESIPESLGRRIEYIVTDGFTRRAPTVGRSLYIPSAQGGNLNLDYYVIARDVASGLEGPRSGPAALNAAQTYTLAEGPTATGNIDVTTTGASVLSGTNVQSVTWTAPPANLTAGENFSIDFTANPSGPPFKYAPSGPFRGRSSPPGLHPARVGASVTLNPNGPESRGIPSGGANAGYFRVSFDECPPDPATLMFCYETTKDDHTETLKVPDDASEFWIVISVGGLDANTTFGEGLVIWKYTADN